MQKGISPLIAGVLMVAFVLAVAAVVGGWFTSVTKTQTREVGSGINQQVECSKAVIDILDAGNSSSGKIFLVIQNSGTVDLSQGFTILCQKGDTSKTATNSSVSLSHGSIATVVFNTLDYNDCQNTNITVTSAQCPSAQDQCTEGDDC